MKINKEDVVLFFKQNVKTIVLALLCSLLVIIGGLLYFNHDKTEDYNDVTFSNSQNSEVSKDDKKEEQDSK